MPPDASSESATLARANRAFADLAVSEALAKVRAIVGGASIPESETAAQAALDKLRSGRERPTAAELSALELVIRMMRPAPLVREGEPDPLPAGPGSSTYNPATVDLWNRFRSAVRPFVYSIGRLDATEGTNPQKGTCFLVADDLVLTNRHVLDALSYGAEVLDEGQAVVRFHREYGSADPSPSTFPLTAIAAVHDVLDMALLRVRLPESRPVVPLREAGVEAAHPVAAVGYPWDDPKSTPLFAQAVYGGKYGVKRAALGEVLSTAAQRLYHDCSTLGGNSGSPVFSLETGDVVGLHRTGLFMWRNEAVPAPDIRAFVAEVNGG